MLGIVLFVLGIILMIGYLVWFCLGQGRLEKTLSMVVNIIMVTISVGMFVACLIVRNSHPTQEIIEPKEVSEVHTDILESQSGAPDVLYRMTETESSVPAFQNDVLESGTESLEQMEMLEVYSSEFGTEASETPAAEKMTDAVESLQDMSEDNLLNLP